jgi:hypothetical protein
LGSSHFARHYFGNHCCFLFLRVLRCFSSPRSPLVPMDSVLDIPTLLGMGSPIQRSPGQSLFSGSPKLIAASHVFHRHPAPRHPPFALSSLAIISYPLFHLRRYLYVPVFCFQRTNQNVSILIAIFRDLPSVFPDGKSRKILYKFRSRNLLVEVNGIEPMTSCVQSRCSPN